MTQKEELAAAQARVQELTDQLSETEAAFKRVEAEKNELSVKVTAGETKIGLLTSESTEQANKISSLTTQHAAEVIRREASEAEVAKLQGEAKTAEQRAREIAARNGTALPNRQQDAGDKTTEKAITGTPRQRLAKVFQPK